MTGSVGKLKFGFNVVSSAAKPKAGQNSPGSHKSRFPPTLQIRPNSEVGQWQDFTLLVTISSHAPFNFGQTLHFYLSVHWAARVYEQMSEAGLRNKSIVQEKTMRGRPKMIPASKGPDTQIISTHEQG